MRPSQFACRLTYLGPLCMRVLAQTTVTFDTITSFTGVPKGATVAVASRYRRPPCRVRASLRNTVLYSRTRAEMELDLANLSFPSFRSGTEVALFKLPYLPAQLLSGAFRGFGMGCP
ncbi:hypothetical protein BCV70DRAFT_105126 [Testicularia cyperi]|uniref:Secreted protein n=1 Tax=Testicularia cyperi TaxID=1882483 RepID=A0A317XP97_9BASI|nr:hypothetical protein BCV70DRAFT_105126 [Testicularia cyperi]